jgi:Uma2 family endonuclease
MDALEPHVLLCDVSWSLYEQMLAETSGRSNPRLTYDRGQLEIMVLSYGHEEINRLINDLLVVVALELDIEYRNAGSTTFKREDLGRGFEPDSCFYVKNSEWLAGRKQLDLRNDPPPDLIVEVEITRSALDKLSIFAAVGVPEVWRFDGERVTVLERVGTEYVEREQSLAFPDLTGARLTEFLETSQRMPRTAWLRSVRDWARAQKEG